MTAQVTQALAEDPYGLADRSTAIDRGSHEARAAQVARLFEPVGVHRTKRIVTRRRAQLLAPAVAVVVLGAVIMDELEPRADQLIEGRCLR